MHGHLDIFQGGHVLEQADVLESPGKAHLCDAVWLHAADLRHLSIHIQFDAALAGLIDAGEQVEQCRLAGAVRADQTDQLMFVDFHADVRDGTQTAEVFRQMLYAKQAHSFSPPFFFRRLNSAEKVNSFVPSRPPGLKIMMPTSARP